MIGKKKVNPFQKKSGKQAPAEDSKKTPSGKMPMKGKMPKKGC